MGKAIFRRMMMLRDHDKDREPERDRIRDDEVRAQPTACFASHSVFLLKNQGQRCLTPAPMVHPVLSGSV